MVPRRHPLFGGAAPQWEGELPNVDVSRPTSPGAMLLNPEMRLGPEDGLKGTTARMRMEGTTMLEDTMRNGPEHGGAALIEEDPNSTMLMPSQGEDGATR